MNTIDNQVKRVNEKLQQVLKNYQLLQKDNERQSKLITELQKAKKNDNLQIATLQERLEIVKAATGEMNETDKKAFERTINQYIKEIDKCIGLLSE